MRREIDNASAPAGAAKRSGYPGARGMVLTALRRLIGPAIRPAEYFALAVLQIRKGSNNAGMQWYAAWVAILCLGKIDVRSA